MRITGLDSPTRIISVGGGKGGVGKSIVAANLSLAVAELGCNVILVDCDLGAGSQHLLFGIDRPRPGLQGLLDGKVASLQAALTATAHPRLRLVAGTGARLGAANITLEEKQRILQQLRSLEADVVVIDVGAGVGYDALDFYELGSQRILVATPQVTSIQTAYSFLKGAVLRTLHHAAERADELALLAPASRTGENEKVSQVLARVKEISPALGDAIGQILGRFGAKIVGNQVFDSAQVGIFDAVSRMMQDFLGITVPVLGTVRASRRIRESVNLRRPMMLGPRDEETRVFTAMADALLAVDVAIDDILVADSERIDLDLLGDPDVRFDVDWKGSLRVGREDRPVRIFEVSARGAVVRGAQPLELGQELVLVFEQIPGQPRAPVKVTRRATLGFAVEGEIPTTVTAAATVPGASSPRRLAG
jgi:flagellar biosynthesis protein FlhG